MLLKRYAYRLGKLQRPVQTDASVYVTDRVFHLRGVVEHLVETAAQGQYVCCVPHDTTWLFYDDGAIHVHNGRDAPRKWLSTATLITHAAATNPPAHQGTFTTCKSHATATHTSINIFARAYKVNKNRQPLLSHVVQEIRDKTRISNNCSRQFGRPV